MSRQEEIKIEDAIRVLEEKHENCECRRHQEDGSDFCLVGCAEDDELWSKLRADLRRLERHSFQSAIEAEVQQDYDAEHGYY